MSKNTIPTTTSVEFRVSENTFIKEMLKGIDRACTALKGYWPWLDWEDIRQEASERAWKHRDAYDPKRAAVGTWTNRIVLNCCNDAKRRSARSQTLFVPLTVEDSDGDEFELTDVVDLVDDSKSTDGLVIGEELQEAIDAAIATLPEKQQLILYLSFDGVPPREIAKEFGCTASYVSSLLFKAKAVVRSLLENSGLAA